MNTANRILVIDTSTSHSAVGLQVGDEWDELQELSPRQSAQKILPLVENLLIKRKLKLKDISVLGLAIGPGSFTGLRVGLGVIQGLSASLNIPVVPISNLALTAFDSIFKHGHEVVHSVIEARESEYYFGSYTKDEVLGVSALGKECIISMDSSGRNFSAISKSEVSVLSGSGAESLHAQLVRQGFDKIELSSNSENNLKSLALLVSLYYAAGICEKASNISPNYIKEQLDY